MLKLVSGTLFFLVKTKYTKNNVICHDGLIKGCYVRRVIIKLRLFRFTSTSFIITGNNTNIFCHYVRIMHDFLPFWRKPQSISTCSYRVFISHVFICYIANVAIRAFWASLKIRNKVFPRARLRGDLTTKLDKLCGMQLVWSMWTDSSINCQARASTSCRSIETSSELLAILRKQIHTSIALLFNKAISLPIRYSNEVGGRPCCTLNSTNGSKSRRKPSESQFRCFSGTEHSSSPMHR